MTDSSPNPSRVIMAAGANLSRGKCHAMCFLLYKAKRQYLQPIRPFWLCTAVLTQKAYHSHVFSEWISLESGQYTR